MKKDNGVETTEQDQAPLSSSNDESVENNLSEIEEIVSSSAAIEKGDDPLDSIPDLAEDEADLGLGTHKVSKFGVTVFFVCLAVVIIGVLIVRSNDQWMEDLDCFWSGDIQRCKLAGVEEQRALWREEEAATRPMYGDVVLTYHPQDAKVTIEQIVRKQDGWKGELSAPETLIVPNRSTELREHELIEQLPLENLPIREREQNEDGRIAEVRHYIYRIRIERDGYEPREFTFEPDDWVRLGPEVNYAIMWPGADLIPKVETVREPFLAAMREINCAEVVYGRQGQEAGQTEADLRAQIREIQVRHGFRTVDEFSSWRAQLTADEAWWNPIREELRTDKCPTE